MQYDLAGKITIEDFRALVIKYFEGSTDGMSPEDKARHQRSQRKLKTIQALFKAMDLDKSGTVTTDEMADALIRAGMAGSREEVDEIFARGDSDNDGELSYKEFMQCFEGLTLEEYTPEEYAMARKRKQLTELFKSLDVDNSGSVTNRELEIGLINAGVVSTTAEANLLFGRGDSDSDGHLTLEEFLGCFEDLNGKVEETPEERLVNLFHSLDDDGTGWVDSKELFEGLKSLGVSVTYDEIKELLAGGDSDGDGRLTLEEFLDCFETVNLEELFDGADLETVERAAKSDAEHRAIVEAEAMQMFYDIDTDQSGFITAQEVIRGIAKLGMQGGSEDIRKLMTLADLDGDGKIEPTEFVQWYLLQHQEKKTRGSRIASERTGVVAPEDVKDGLGEHKNGDIEISAIKTLLAVGGISRVVTAIAVLQLVDDGRIELEEDIGRYMDPQIRFDGRGRAWAPTTWLGWNRRRGDESWDRGLTVEHLLCHLSGLDTSWTSLRPEGWKSLEVDGAKRGRAEVQTAAEQQQAALEAQAERERRRAARVQEREQRMKRGEDSGRRRRRKRTDKSTEPLEKYRDQQHDYDSVSTRLVDDGRPLLAERFEAYCPRCVSPPGGIYSDPTMGYAILGHIIENVSGLSFWQYCAFNIFTGLSMSTSTFGGPGFPNPGPDPNALQKEEAEAKRKSSEKMRKRQAQLDLDRARLKAIRKADEAKRNAAWVAQRRGEEVARTGGTPFTDFVEAKRRMEEEQLRQATELQWKTDFAWERQMDEERARQRAAERDWAAFAVRRGFASHAPEGWVVERDGEWPPQLWHGFRAWTGMRMIAWMSGVPRPPSGGSQLTLHRVRRKPIPVLVPSLGLLSTGRDMGRLMLGLVSNGKYKGKQALTARLVSMFYNGFASPHPFIGGITRGGMAHFRDGPNTAYVCDGADIATGSSSSMFLMPHHGVGLFVSFNCCSGHGMHRIHPSIFERFLDHFYPIPVPPTPPSTPPSSVQQDSGSLTVDAYDPPDEKERLLEWKSLQTVQSRVEEIFITNKVDLLNTFTLMDTDGHGVLPENDVWDTLQLLLPELSDSHIEYISGMITHTEDFKVDYRELAQKFGTVKHKRAQNSPKKRQNGHNMLCFLASDLGPAASSRARRCGTLRVSGQQSRGCNFFCASTLHGSLCKHAHAEIDD
eukprot:SAG31_NODE_1520_length_8024_cov_7.506625_3_plen_1166_part_00